MKLIVAVDEKWGIGKDNALLFRLKEDMRHFVAETMGKTVVMGKNTLLSFPGGKPLKNRRNVVLTRGNFEGCECVADLGALFSLTDVDWDETYVIGGASVYRLLLPYCREAIITKVAADGGADAFFPDLDRASEWELAEEGEVIRDGEYAIKFCRYKNKDVKVYR